MQTKQAEANAVESGLLRFAHMWLQGSKASSDRPECQNVTTSDQHMQTIFPHIGGRKCWRDMFLHSGLPSFALSTSQSSTMVLQLLLSGVSFKEIVPPCQTTPRTYQTFALSMGPQIDEKWGPMNPCNAHQS